MDRVTQGVVAWHRQHRDRAKVRATVVLIADGDAYRLSFEGWTAPTRFTVGFLSLEAAQRAADDAVGAYLPHDCRVCLCADWEPVTRVLPESRPGVRRAH